MGKFGKMYNYAKVEEFYTLTRKAIINKFINGQISLNQAREAISINRWWFHSMRGYSVEGYHTLFSKIRTISDPSVLAAYSKKNQCKFVIEYRDHLIPFYEDPQNNFQTYAVVGKVHHCLNEGTVDCMISILSQIDIFLDEEELREAVKNKSATKR